MLYQVCDISSWGLLAFAGVFYAFGLTLVFLAKYSKILPKDGGREFAHDGKLSAGKPRGAGILFVPVFLFCALFFAAMSVEYFLYLVLVAVGMMTGYLDDAAKTPWGEYKKGILDLCVALVTAITYVANNGSTLHFYLLQVEDFTLPAPLFVLAATVLIWVSVNVTNCADGVDGLSGTLTIITLGGIYLVCNAVGAAGDFTYQIVLFCMCILAYLWFNATPSTLMMGDAGSRAMGLFIAIAVLKSGAPLLYVLVAFVLLLDGGLGLIKVALLRFLKISTFKNIRMPLHDHVRKSMGWSNTQCVYRFAIVQIMVLAALLYALAL